MWDVVFTFEDGTDYRVTVSATCAAIAVSAAVEERDRWNVTLPHGRTRKIVCERVS